MKSWCVLRGAAYLIHWLEYGWNLCPDIPFRFASQRQELGNFVKCSGRLDHLDSFTSIICHNSAPFDWYLENTSSVSLPNLQRNLILEFFTNYHSLSSVFQAGRDAVFQQNSPSAPPLGVAREQEAPLTGDTKLTRIIWKARPFLVVSLTCSSRFLSYDSPLLSISD